MMCPPSPGNRGRAASVEPVLLFDTNRRAHHDKFKRGTADLSQVCDGRNWELFRQAAHGRPSSRRSSTKKREGRARRSSEDDVGADRAASKETKSRLVSSYKPIRTRSTKEKSNEPVSRQQDDDKLLASMGKASFKERGHPQASKERPLARPVSPGSSGKDARRRPSSSRRRSDASSASAPRRHSDDGAPPSKKDLAKGKAGRRRLSVDSNTVTSVPNLAGPRVTVRRLSEPMHRCSITNQNVSGIMRQARYSSNNLTSLAENDNASPQSLKPRLSESATQDLGLSSKIDNDHVRKRMPRSSSMEDLSKLKIKQTGPGVSSADWVASGVNFSKSMEVYVFKT